MNFQMNLPSKKSFKFNEVSSLLNVKPYVLRFWETEFPQIGVEFKEDGSKLYGQQSLKVVEKIKELLFEQKLSIPEAKSWLDSHPDLSDKTHETSSASNVFSEKILREAFIQDSVSEKPSEVTLLSGQEKLAQSLDNILKTIDHIIEKNKWS